jgi:hypothetical protein
MPTSSISASCICCADETPVTIEIDIFGGTGCYSKFAGQYKLQIVGTGAETCQWSFTGDFGGKANPGGSCQIVWTIDCSQPLKSTILLTIEDLVEGSFLLFHSDEVPNQDCCADFTMKLPDASSCGMDDGHPFNTVPKVFIFPSCTPPDVEPIGGLGLMGVGGTRVV